jgi:hypothetical protein
MVKVKYLIIWLVMFQYVNEPWSPMPGRAYNTEAACKSYEAIWLINARDVRYAPKIKCEFYPDGEYSSA